MGNEGNRRSELQGRCTEEPGTPGVRVISLVVFLVAKGTGP